MNAACRIFFRVASGALATFPVMNQSNTDRSVCCQWSLVESRGGDIDTVPRRRDLRTPSLWHRFAWGPVTERQGGERRPTGRLCHRFCHCFSVRAESGAGGAHGRLTSCLVACDFEDERTPRILMPVSAL